MSKTQRLFNRLAKRQVKITKLREHIWTVNAEGSGVSTWVYTPEDAKQEQQRLVRLIVRQLRESLKTLKGAGLRVSVRAL